MSETLDRKAMFRGRIVWSARITTFASYPTTRRMREGWWSLSGSNRRPHACKARALPAELRPHNQETNASRSEVVGLGRLELPTSRLSSARSNQLSYKPVTLKALERRSARHSRRPYGQTTAARPRSAFQACVFVREERETKTAKSRQWNSPRSGDRDGP
jgi:hypothetical protein